MAYVIAFGELFIKSDKVKNSFKSILVKNLKYFLTAKKIDFEIFTFHDRLLIKTEKNIESILKNTFGISWFAKADFLDFSDISKITKHIEKNYSSLIKESETFAIRARRDNSIKTNSQDLGYIFGEVVDRKVSLKNPDKEIFVELRKEGTYIYFDKIKAYDGLPVGSSGKVLSLMSAGIDSPVSSFLMLKRGCELSYLHFHSFPLVSKASINKTKELLEILKDCQIKPKLFLVPFHKIQMEIKMKIEQEYRIVLYRRFMLRIAEEIAKKDNCQALLTGESLAQVSSQTLTNMSVIQSVVSPDIPIIRPLVGYNKEEIITIAKEINTYDISIQPQEDCCTLFTPKHPTTKANMKKVLELEALLDVDKLIANAINELETIVFK
jgi:thiamine biosynthesis protein ThiI